MGGKIQKLRKVARKILHRSSKHSFLSLAFLLVLCFTVGIWLCDVNQQFGSYGIWFEHKNCNEAWQIACYHDNVNNTLPELEDNITPDNGIFFLETSCHTEPGVHLNPRQACAVESAALLHPHKDVYVLFPGPVAYDDVSLSLSVRQLLLYPNVRLRHIPLQRYFTDTPLDEWYHSGLLETSCWPRAHTSDVLRFLTLWKYGGIYLDMDTVVIKSLTNMSNFVGAESEKLLGSAVMSFSHQGVGRHITSLCMREIRLGFQGDDWASNGPAVVTRVLKHVCATDQISEMSSERCDGFTVFPPKTFFPLNWDKWELYFNEEDSEKTLLDLGDSHVIHVWNKLSYATNVTVNSRQPYAVIASQFCPRVYSHVGKVF